jgi:hypothetical protein
LKLDLGAIFTDPPSWAPDNVFLGASQRSAIEPTLFGSGDAVRRSYGLGAAKTGDHFYTDVYFYWNERNDFSDAAGFENTTEFGADIVQSFFFDDWDLSLYALMSDMKRRSGFARDRSERIFSGGAAFSKKFERLPDIRVSVDAFQLDADYLRDDYAFESHDISLRAEADISEMLLTGLNYNADENRPLSVYLGAYSGWSIFDDSLSAGERDNETRLLIMLRRENLQRRNR